jgi:hypothetical protein
MGRYLCWISSDAPSLETGAKHRCGNTCGSELVFSGEITDAERAKMAEELIALQLGDVVLLHR